MAGAIYSVASQDSSAFADHRARARSSGSSERQPGRFVHSIDGLVARRRPSGQPHRTGFAVGIGLRRWDDITLGDGEGQGERAPSRYARSLLRNSCAAVAAELRDFVRGIRPQLFVTSDRTLIWAGFMFVSSDGT